MPVLVNTTEESCIFIWNGWLLEKDLYLVIMHLDFGDSFASVYVCSQT